MAFPSHDNGSEPIDLAQYPTAQKLVETCQKFLSEVQDLTPGKDLEKRLNTEYGPGTPLYEDMCKYVRQGLDEGWVAMGEVDGQRYRRGMICAPSAENRFFSITTVYMNSEEEYSGQNHG